jgi:hypothetical protein
MAFTVPSNYNQNQSASAATVSVAIAQAQAAGDTIVAFVACGTGSAAVPTLSDTELNNYGSAVGSIVDLGNNIVSYVFVVTNAKAAAASANTVQVNWGGTVFEPEIVVIPIKGANGTDGANFNDSVGTSISTSLTTIAAGDLLIAYAYSTGGGFVNNTGGAGWTQLGVITPVLESYIQYTSTAGVPAGPYTATCDASGFNLNAQGIVALKAAGGGISVPFWAAP